MDDCYFVKLLNVLSFFSELFSFSPFASYFSHILTVVWRIQYISYLKLVFFILLTCCSTSLRSYDDLLHYLY